MSFQITTAFVQQFKSNITLLSQQKGSKLRDKVRLEPITGESAFYDQVGATEAQDKTTRHGDTPVMSTPHSRRMVVPTDADWGDLIDNLDKAKTLNDPTNTYTTSGVYALGRKIDDRIIAAATGTARTGKDGATNIVLPETQKLAVTLGALSGKTNAGLSIEKLIAAKSKFGKADIDLDDPENKLYMAVTQQQLDDLLNLTEIKSSDYNTIKALAKGDVDSYMGFDFIRTQRLVLNVSTDIRTCFAWALSGLLLAVNEDIKAEMEKRADKCFSTQVYACMSVGATRMEENKVVEIPCDESP